MFTQPQLDNMTLDELERYHNLDKTDLGLCHAFINKQRDEINELHVTIDKLQNDNFMGD